MNQGIQTEGKGSVQLTSSLRLLVLLKRFKKFYECNVASTKHVGAWRSVVLRLPLQLVFLAWTFTIIFAGNFDATTFGRTTLSVTAFGIICLIVTPSIYNDMLRIAFLMVSWASLFWVPHVLLLCWVALCLELLCCVPLCLGPLCWIRFCWESTWRGCYVECHHYDNCHFAQCHYAECRGAFICHSHHSDLFSLSAQ